jgi:ABC-type transport system involved in multi-copper enzyme maturation permease subunit
MQAISAVARNAFREAIRDRILFSLLFFALLMVSAAILFTQMSFGIPSESLVNFSLTAITFFGVIIAVFLGNQLVSKEIEKRTLYTLLAHPVKRTEFVLGKFCGLLLTLVVNCGLMMLAFLIALTFVQRGFVSGEGALGVAAWLIFLQLALLTGLSLLFSCFSSPLLAALFSLALFIVGNFTGDLRALGQATHSAAGRNVLVLASYLLPSFSDFNVVTAASHFQHISGGFVLLDTAYAVTYSAILLIAAAAIMEKKDLK